MKKKNSIILISVICIILVIGIVFMLILKNGDRIENENLDNQKNETNEQKTLISFSNMKIDNPDLNLTEKQKEVLQYFDNDYFAIENYENLQRYPNIYKGSQIMFTGQIKKVIKSTDTEYEFLVNFNPDGEYFYEEDLNPDELFVIKGEQTDKRFIKGDFIEVYGRYKNIDNYEIDGISYTLPTINAFKVIDATSLRFDLDTITKVARDIFGEDIKIKEPVSGIDYQYNQISEASYLVTLDNQSNANFQSFVFTREVGSIADKRLYTENAGRKIYISADLEHYIIKVYEENTKHMYLEYYTRDLSKVWSREFDNVTDIPMDYTTETIALVADNDLYLIDTNTGENIIEPSFVGTKTNVLLIEDGAILIGKEAKDMIMKVDMNGKILWKTSTQSSNDYEYSKIQIVNDNLVINWLGEKDGYLNDAYIVLDKDGNKILETD